MSIAVFDTESDGLLEEATILHCAVVKDTDGKYQFPPDKIKDFLEHLSTYDIIVAHNVIEHDLPLLYKLYGYKYKGIVVDTLVLSRLADPMRVGRHSIEAWGERFGVPKPDHDDWSTYTPEMLHRCDQDVEINWLVLFELLKETNLTVEDLCQLKRS